MSQQSYSNPVEELQSRINKHLDEARKNSYNALTVGDSTIQALQEQSESLQNTENLLEENEELIKQSLRVLRGMTWTGSIYNIYSDIAGALSTTASKQPDTTESTGHQRETTNELKHIPAPLYRSQQITINTEKFSCANPEDAALDELAKAVDTLKNMGIVIGQQLQQQNSQIDRIDSASDIIHDKTLEVSIKATKLGKQSKTDAGVYAGTFQFLATNHLFMLAANGESLVLTTSADPSTLFRCYIRQNTIVGLQNEVTGKFIGCTIWGTVAVSGEYFGSHEECYIDLDGNESGLMFAARNWGSGGWLKMNTEIPPEAYQPGLEFQIVVSSTTSNMTDRTDIVNFRAIRSK